MQHCCFLINWVKVSDHCSQFYVHHSYFFGLQNYLQTILFKVLLVWIVTFPASISNSISAVVSRKDIRLTSCQTVYMFVQIHTINSASLASLTSNSLALFPGMICLLPCFIDVCVDSSGLWWLINMQITKTKGASLTYLQSINATKRSKKKKPQNVN